MADVFLYNKNSSEQQNIASCVYDAVAFITEDNIELYKLNSLNDSYRFLNKESKMDMAIVEISDTKEINFVGDFREKIPNTEIMLIADSTLSPMHYITPKIKASALLLSPYTKQQLKDIIFDFATNYYNSRENEVDDKTLEVNTKDGKEYILFSSIVYIEVREKRVFIRLKNREYSQFGTLESFLSIFPDYFIRCHRSYAFNTRMLSSIKYSENIINLSYGISVPLSRTHKKEVKEYLRSNNV